MSESKPVKVRESVEEVNQGREIELHFIRHGEPINYSYDAGITPKSVKQAEKFGRDLIHQIRDGELVKLVTSPQKRATETLDGIEKGMKASLKDHADKKVVLYTEGRKRRNEVRMFEIIDRKTDWFNKFKDDEDSIKYWLDNPDEVAEPPEKVLQRMEKFIKRMKAVSEFLPSGPKVHYVIVTHSGPMRVLLRKSFTKTDVDYGESMNLKISGNKKEKPVIEYNKTVKDWSN